MGQGSALRAARTCTQVLELYPWVSAAYGDEEATLSGAAEEGQERSRIEGSVALTREPAV